MFKNFNYLYRTIKSRINDSIKKNFFICTDIYNRNVDSPKSVFLFNFCQDINEKTNVVFLLGTFYNRFFLGGCNFYNHFSFLALNFYIYFNFGTPFVCKLAIVRWPDCLLEMRLLTKVT